MRLTAALIVAAGLAGTIALILLPDGESVERRAKEIGIHICRSVGSGKLWSGDHEIRIPDVFAVGPSLTARLRELAPSLRLGCAATVRAGDIRPPYGNGTATHVLTMSSEGEPLLEIRLRYDLFWNAIAAAWDGRCCGDDFVILGYMSSR